MAFWTKRRKKIAGKVAGHAEEEVLRGADCEGASSDYEELWLVRLFRHHGARASGHTRRINRPDK
jgi:hypothetical protein